MKRFRDSIENEIHKGRRSTVRRQNMFWLLSETRKLMTRARAHAEDGDTIRVTIEIIARKPSRIVEHRPPREGVLREVRLTWSCLVRLRRRAMERRHYLEMRRITADYWEHWSVVRCRGES